MLSAAWIKERIQAHYPDALVEAKDLTGGGDHWDVQVVSEAFRGKRLIQQHQLVYACFEEELRSGSLHALALKTWSPEQWAAQRGQ